MTAAAQLNLPGCPPLNPALSQYHTHEKLAAQMAELLGPVEQFVLEPSAGGGNIVAALLKANHSVHAVEIDPAWTGALRSRFPISDSSDPSLTLATEDFLAFEPECQDDDVHDYDAVVMNPPLDGGQGPVHVAHALRFAPRVISVLRSGDLHPGSAYRTLWSRCFVYRLVQLVGRGGFDGAQSDFVVVDVWGDEVLSVQQAIEWWEI